MQESKFWNYHSSIMRQLSLLTRRGAVLRLTVLFAAAPAITHAATPVASQSLVVTGDVKKPLILTVEDLKAFPANDLGSLVMTRRVDNKDTSSTLRGVRLTAVLDRAALVDGDHNLWKHSLVLATATDGYQVVFSWPELFNTEIGNGVLVVFERDGQLLADDEGRIALISGQDTRTGPRHVRWLSKLEVRIVRD